MLTVPFAFVLPESILNMVEVTFFYAMAIRVSRYR